MIRTVLLLALLTNKGCWLGGHRRGVGGGGTAPLEMPGTRGDLGHEERRGAQTALSSGFVMTQTDSIFFRPGASLFERTIKTIQ
jgi:hypothetical protein